MVQVHALVIDNRAEASADRPIRLTYIDVPSCPKHKTLSASSPERVLVIGRHALVEWDELALRSTI